MRFDQNGDVGFQLDLLLNAGLDLFDNFRLPVELGIETEFNRVAYGWPSLSAAGVLTNDGFGGLSWAAQLGSALGLITAVVTKTAIYTATASDHVILCDASGGAFTVTLPAGITGTEYHVKKIDSSANAVTIDGFGSETIDGDLTVDISTQYESLMFKSDGSNWHVL